MKLNPVKFSIASAISSGFLWLGCSLLVWWQPESMMSLSSNMFHANLTPMTWELSPRGVLLGGAAWVIFSAIFSWLLVVIYNQLSGSDGV